MVKIVISRSCIPNKCPIIDSRRPKRFLFWSSKFDQRQQYVTSQWQHPKCKKDKQIQPSPLSLFQAASRPLVNCPNISARTTLRICLLTVTLFEFTNAHTSLCMQLNTAIRNRTKPNPIRHPCPKKFPKHIYFCH